MTPIMPIGSIVIYCGERRINMWSHSVVPHVWGVKRFSNEDENRISLKDSLGNDNSKITFQKMLKCAMEELNSDCILNVKGSEEHIDKINQTSFEKNYYENSRKEIIYWNNVLARMLDLNSNNNYI
jgi:hypothetical protein